jgi:hypothetical protein
MPVVGASKVDTDSGSATDSAVGTFAAVETVGSGAFVASSEGFSTLRVNGLFDKAVTVVR